MRNLVCMGGCFAPVPNDASADQSADGSTPDVTADAAVCDSIRSDYATALASAQECTVGAPNQCTVQVRAGFFCGCTTYANGSADTLAAIAANFQADGCATPCIGTCVALQALSCVADKTSSTGGRCKLPGVMNLTAASNGGTFSVPVGEEIDILLESSAPGSYSTDVTLSSSLATVLEITIPAGPPTPNGVTHLYRLRALSAGQLFIQIPFEPAASGAPQPTYAVTVIAR